jgi:hypothetical protein
VFPLFAGGNIIADYRNVMTIRLYFMLPNVAVCSSVVEELKAEKIPERHMHAIASAALSLDGLPEASMLQKSEFVHGVEKGVSLGGVAGLLGGLLTITFPPAGLALGGAAVAATTLAGAGFGALVSGLLATDIPNHEVEAFEEGIKAGGVLLMVDVPKKKADRYIELIKAHHPVVEIGVSEPPEK